jgi:hypothetical protein
MAPAGTLARGRGADCAAQPECASSIRGNKNFNRHLTAQEGSWPCLQSAEVRKAGRIQR